MAKRITSSTPKQDGFRMPGEYEKQEKVWMIWPEKPDVWRDGGKPAQKAYTVVATAIAKYAEVTVCVSTAQYQNARARLPENIRVVEMASNDAWMRDMGPIFVKNDTTGEIRAVDFGFNAWGGLVNGLYFPWDLDQQVAQKVCELEGVDSYNATDFVLEGGAITVDGEGTLITTEMCLLDPGRNPELTKEDIEEKLKEYLGVEKIIWLKDGIDPDETNGHIDGVAAFVAPGEVACVWTDDETSPLYPVLKDAYETLCAATDAKGRKLKVHKLCMGANELYIDPSFDIDQISGTLARDENHWCPVDYLNWLIINGAVIVPQYGDPNDALALQQIGEMFPGYDIVGVDTREIIFGGGNVHCITQQQSVRGVVSTEND